MSESTSAPVDRKARAASRLRPGALSASELDEMFREYRATGDRSLRNRLVEAHLHTADYYVARYARSSASSAEDLHQTGLFAVLKAVERFDPDLGVSFKTFASRTIEGELKRYLRDRSWAVRPPRRAQELHLDVRRTTEEMTQQLGRAPTVSELAHFLEVTEEQVLEAMEAGQARSSTTIDAPLGPDNASTLASALGGIDASFALIDDRLQLHTALACLDERERLVLKLRFIDDLSQPDIAELIGVSQSYVSRIMRGSLTRLRIELSSS